jgi:uncharacterized protein
MAKQQFKEAAKIYTVEDLCEAIDKNDLPSVKQILASKQITDLNQCDEKSWTPLLKAMSQGNVECITAVLDAGADMNARELNMGHTPLSRAISGWYGGKPQVVSLLLSRGADPNILPLNPQEGGLLAAVERGYETITLMLLARGADIEAEDTWGKTPIHVAAEHGHAGIIRILAEHGAELNKHGALALSKAISSHSREAFDALLECGANPAAPLRDGKTLLMVAAEAGETGMMAPLVAAGLDLDCVDGHGKTALMYSAEHGKGESVRKLLALGANPSVTSPEGLTARQIAEQAGHEHILYTIDNAPRKGAPASTRPFRIKLAAKNG